MTPDDHRQDTQGGEELGLVMAPRVRRAGRGARSMLFAGVAGACVLGVGLGLWARPAMNERRVAAAAPEPVAPPADPAARKLRIVVDDRPAPVVAASLEAAPSAAGPPGPVATPVAAAFATPAPPAPAPAPAAVPPPPLVRVQAPLPPAPSAAPPPWPTPSPAKPLALPKLTPLMVAALAEARMVGTRLSKPIPPLVRLAPPPTQLAKAEPAPPPKPKPKAAAAASPAHAIQLAQAAHAAAERATAAKAAAERAHAEKLAAAKAAAAHRIELARAAEAQKVQKAEIQKAKFEKAKADRLEKARLAKAAQAEQIKLAKAEARGRAEAKAEARAEALAEARDEARKQIRLASLARVVRQVLPHPASPPAPVHVAKLDRKHSHRGRHEPIVQPASLKSRRPAHAAEPPARSRPQPIAPQARPSGLMRVSAQRCASRDPGEALVCADPSLGAADRQLSRAYQGARAAGVPEAQLQRQQQRWLAARSAAAREAPWAVHDVYLARIAELNSLAHDAHGDGF
jgi:hypothetical protein